MLIGNSSATNASVNIFFFISVYILVFNVYCLYSMLFYVILCYSVLFYSILFCKDINKTQFAPRFFPKRAWGILYYYHSHLFLSSFVILPCSLLQATNLFVIAFAALCHTICCSLLCHLLRFVMLYDVLYRSISVHSPSIANQEQHL